MSRPKAPTSARTVRCAIYTRKSSEEGLEQAFNSLHAQREACEAYVLSQAGEGWIALPTVYDDGGFSGGNIDRPAMKRLLTDVASGLIDVVVVYKVDRLTRCLADFAKIVDVLDAQGASFVSVTQAFNTTTSMGRLTLNVLLSFAQFEREVTGERIRDKIAASKAKGIWMGGMVPLGYDVIERELIVNEPEAERVRSIFRRYVELGSVPELKEELARGGEVSKRWTSSRGRAMGGVPFTCGALYFILQNRLYLGQIVHKAEVHPGRHPPIVDEALFLAVQNRLAGNRQTFHSRPRRAAKSPLTGLIYDAEGVLMSPSFAFGQNGRAYRYYVSAAVLPGREHPGGPAETIRRLPAAAIEDLVLDRVRRITARPYLAWDDAKPLVRRVAARAASVDVDVSVDADQLAELGFSSARSAIAERLALDDDLSFEAADDAPVVRVRIPLRPVFRGGRTSFSAPEGQRLRRRANPNLVRGLKNAHAVLRGANASPLGRPDAMAAAQAPDEFNARRILPLGFLAPDIQQAIIEGRQPAELNVKRMLAEGVPLAWEDQRRKFGFAV